MMMVLFLFCLFLPKEVRRIEMKLNLDGWLMMGFCILFSLLYVPQSRF